jgi:hypothetical protein
LKRVGELLKAFLSSRLSQEGESVLSLVEAWREVAGEAAPHVRVRDFRSGTVVLEADHPGWGQLVGLRAASLVKGLQTRVPELEIRSLRVTVSRIPAEPARTLERAGGEQSSGTGPPPKAESGAIEETLSAVPDEGLRRALRALYEKADGSEDRAGR